MERHLQETYGIMVYQEQVMRLAADLAGLTLGEADILRKAMGKKDRELMAAAAREVHRRLQGQRDRCAQGAERIWELIEKFAGYGFNKTHAACYGIVAYQTAYLKANYPVEFMAALLTSEMDKTDKIVQYMDECRAMGLRVVPPDVNVSRFAVHRERRRRSTSGSAAIKNVGRDRDRDPSCGRAGAGGAFTSLDDFCSRGRPAARQPARDGEPDQGGRFRLARATRAGLLAALDQAMEAGQRRQRDRDEGQARCSMCWAAAPAAVAVDADGHRRGAGMAAEKSCWRTRRRSWASTSPGTRSSVTATSPGGWARRRRGARARPGRRARPAARA